MGAFFERLEAANLKMLEDVFDFAKSRLDLGRYECVDDWIFAISIARAIVALYRNNYALDQSEGYKWKRELEGLAEGLREVFHGEREGCDPMSEGEIEYYLEYYNALSSQYYY